MGGREMKLKVGDKLYDGSAEEWDIVSVGTKYYTAKRGYGEKKVNIESLTYTDKNYSQHSIQFYLTRQEVLDNKEMSIIYSEVCRYFRNNYSCKLSLEQLRQIKQIISS